MKIWIGLAFALLAGCMPWSDWLDEFAGVSHLVGYELVWWAIVGAMLAYVRGIERRPLSSIGLGTPRLRGIAVGVAAGVALTAALAVIYLAIAPDEQAAVDRLMATPLWWRAISVVRAAVAEEVLYRGYAIERMYELTRNRAAAAVVPCAVFAIAHVGPWSLAHVVVAGAGGAAFTALYLWRRDLWTCIAAHLVVDGMAVLAG